jgi:hypothetical protein
VAKSERGQARGPKMYNPDTEEVRQVRGPEVKEAKEEGFVVVGNRPQEEYLGKTREELEELDNDEVEGTEEEEGPATNTAGFEPVGASGDDEGDEGEDPADLRPQ